ncbi:hypothetical protein ACQY0O_008250 [Thecaphora frezii]
MATSQHSSYRSSGEVDIQGYVASLGLSAGPKALYQARIFRSFAPPSSSDGQRPSPWSSDGPPRIDEDDLEPLVVDRNSFVITRKGIECCVALGFKEPTYAAVVGLVIFALRNKLHGYGEAQ